MFIMVKTNLKTLAYNTIKQKIVTCEYAPGTFLNEEILTDEEKFHQDITQFEYEWTLKNEDFPIISEENPISLAKELILKYDDDFCSLYP